MTEKRELNVDPELLKDPEKMKREVERIKARVKNPMIRVQKLLELSMAVQVEREKEKVSKLQDVLVKNAGRPSPIEWD